MSTTPADPFDLANYSLRRADYQRWHRGRCRQQVLRCQLGFTELDRTASSGRPAVCQGCIHYHGIAYGYDRHTRTRLICGFHPSGWLSDAPCPDWRGEIDPSAPVPHKVWPKNTGSPS